jgi:hypothetical protein
MILGTSLPIVEYKIGDESGEEIIYGFCLIEKQITKFIKMDNKEDAVCLTCPYRCSIKQIKEGIKNG